MPKRSKFREFEPGSPFEEPPLPGFLRRKLPGELQKFPWAEEESEYAEETSEESPEIRKELRDLKKELGLPEKSRRPRRRSRRLREEEEESPEEEEEDFFERGSPKVNPNGGPDGVAGDLGISREELLGLMSRRDTWAWERAAAEFPPLTAIPAPQREAVEAAIKARARAIAEEALEKGGGMARMALKGIA